MTVTPATMPGATGTTVHDPAGLQVLVDVLTGEGYEVLGPQVVDGVVAIRPLTSIDQLPVGWTDTQQPGRYRLDHVGPDQTGPEQRRGSERFGYAVGPQSWKPLLHRPHVHTLTMRSSADQNGHDVQVEVVTPRERRRAFLGVRPCELAAIGRHDTVLLDGPITDRHYRSARNDAVLIVVNCARPAATCFCTSVGTGPTVADDCRLHDLEITEFTASAAHGGTTQYALTAISGLGRHLADAVRAVHPGRPLDADDEHAMSTAERAAVDSMTRHLDTDHLADDIVASRSSARWEAIAERCLTCGNCTAVCPTCFCTGTDDFTGLGGDEAQRFRTWDSCFSLEFSRLGGNVVRASVASRYRQWLVHKLGTWHDQFGEGGCVGCGRCITWCPVGIDLTAEAPLLTGRAPTTGTDGDTHPGAMA